MEEEEEELIQFIRGGVLRMSGTAGLGFSGFMAILLLLIVSFYLVTPYLRAFCRRSREITLYVHVVKIISESSWQFSLSIANCVKDCCYTLLVLALGQ